MGNPIRDNLPALVIGLVNTVRTQGSSIPLLTGYGLGLAVNHVNFEVGRQLLTLEYSVTEDEDVSTPQGEIEGIRDLQALKERRRLDRGVECFLPGSHGGWDVQISTRSSSSDFTTSPASPWAVHANHPSLSTQSPGMVDPKFLPPILLRISHPKPPDHSVLKVTIAIEHAAGTKSLRVNGSHEAIGTLEPRNPSSFASRPSTDMVVEGASDASDFSINTTSTTDTMMTSSSGHTRRTQTTSGVAAPVAGSPRSPAAEKSVLTVVRRNYIYFTSLLQEPEAKWSRAINEAKGVTVTRLNSIDPTLVVYKAEVKRSHS